MSAPAKAFIVGYIRMTLRRAVKAGLISGRSERCLLENMRNSSRSLSDLISFLNFVDYLMSHPLPPIKANF